MVRLLAGAAVGWTVTYVLREGVLGLLERAGLVATNYRGRTVPQGAGLVLPVGYAAGLAVTGLPAETMLTAAMGCFALAMAGLLDDVASGDEPKGWLGHLSALRGGRLTAGGFKAITGLLLVLLIGATGHWTAAIAAVLAANLANTLDVRPMRANAFLALSSLGLAAVAGWRPLLLVAPMLGAALALAPADRSERLILGDAGANALGFVAGLGWGFAGPRQGAAFAAIAGLVVLLGDRFSLGRWQVVRKAAPNPSAHRQR